MPPVRAHGPSWRSSLLSLGELVGIALVLGAVVMGLNQLSFYAAPPGSASQTGSGGDSPDDLERVVAQTHRRTGAIRRWEVRRLRIPETLAELARQQLHSRVIRDHEDLTRYLEQRNKQGLWYAINLEGERSGGGRSTVTYIRHPYDEPYRFPEYLQILARAVGKSSENSPFDFYGASVDVFSDELMNEGPAKLRAEIAPPPGADRRGATTE
jgi:hypothetical protein